MPAPTAIALLAAELGFEIGKKVLSKLTRGKGYKQRLADVTELINGGSSAFEAFHKAFGRDFDQALSSVFGPFPPYTFEDGGEDYVKLSSAGGDDNFRVLRDELNLNLGRISRLPRRQGDLDPKLLLRCLPSLAGAVRRVAGRR